MNFIQQAYKGKNDWWLYVLGFMIIFIFWQIIGVIPFVFAGFSYSQDMSEFVTALETNFATLNMSNNLKLALMLLTGVFGFYSVKYVVKLLHKRDFKSVITSRSRVDWNRILFGFLLITVLQLINFSLSFMGDTSELVWNFKPIPFFTLVIISFILFPFQTATEELIFRGYLMQGIGVTTKSKFAALIITSLFFGIIHGSNPEVAALGWSVMIFYIGTGLLYGISTLMDNGMELALGMHAANNIMASLLITAGWTLIQTDALYIDNSEPSAGIATYLPVLIIYPIILFIFSRKYGWSDWKEKLIGKIEDPTIIEKV